MSVSVDLGWWSVPGGRKALLCWNPHSGELVLHNADGLTNTIIAVIYSETELRRRIDGWVDHAGTRNGLAWLAGQLEDCR